MSTYQRNMALTGEPPKALNTGQKVGSAIGLFGLGILVLSIFNITFPNKALWLTISLSMIAGGIIWFARSQYKNTQPGIKNNGVWFKSISSRGLLGWLSAVGLCGFYIVLYFYPQYLGQGSDGAANTGLIGLFDPLSYLLKGQPASQWFVYGVLYTIAIISFGIKFLMKYRHNRYERLRTYSVMFFQTAFAFLIPEIMAGLNGDLPYYDLKNVWPLNYYLFDQWNVNGLLANGSIGLTLLLWGIASIFVITPILTYKYGKRWYCSWVCGCGGLAETAGDAFRQLSDKSRKAWKVERWLVHTVLVFAVISTTGVIHSYLGDGSKYWLSASTFLIGVAVFLTLLLAFVWIFRREELKKDAKFGAVGFLVIILSFIAMHFFSQTDSLFFFKSHEVRSTYGFLIGSIFSGVVGTGFYPIMGSRVWCRFGCPMAAILGLQQRLFSKFRITTNGGQCISCGNCSTYCEMGIDVRAYAQKGENIVRASCVGCGVCSAVCPRGVLKLENGPLEGRINPQDVLLGQDVDLMELLKK
ncbi:iron-sulfur cluster-binding protein [Nonlabens tegetincola]|uniref:Iron-sulfur cluster-binding protein n=1 Tax=Nonlabens tegetincola TaxID=323273 RepID=A0A090PZU3_9FLAO|nr:4Fe-4S dicluster domain-containing protein [Nonlabens tegetincola]GAK95412.1 iron-sulfur cluster-binding protein [Nonlabens tegetincola]